jgi:CheY-like chemotaxis protein
MLFNLLSNAGKFTEDGEIRLRCRRESHGGRDWLLFEVEDTGIGMSEEQQQRVFEPFSQADASTTRKYGGTGLGLAITRRFAQMLGGEILLRSSEGEGTTFTLRLPADAGAAASPTDATAETADAPAGSHEGPVILLIDDEPAACDMVSRMLARDGLRTVSAHDGETGLRLARELRPSVILLDVLMPSLDGWAVLSRLKADPALAEIPVVMVSVAGDQAMGVALGASDHLDKPVDRARLAQVLDRHLRREPAEAP